MRCRLASFHSPLLLSSPHRPTNRRQNHPTPPVLLNLGTPGDPQATQAQPPTSKRQPPSPKPHPTNLQTPNRKQNVSKQLPQNSLKPAKTFVFLKVFIHFQFLGNSNKDPPKHLKDHQMGTARSPNGAQRVPGDSQNRAKEPPRTTQEHTMPPRSLSRCPQEPPRHQKGSPRDHFWTFFGSKIRFSRYLFGA